MDVIGNILTLYDLTTRILGFIGDVRHAQDDFIMLRNEAHCLCEYYSPAFGPNQSRSMDTSQRPFYASLERPDNPVSEWIEYADEQCYSDLRERTQK